MYTSEELQAIQDLGQHLLAKSMDEHAYGAHFGAPEALEALYNLAMELVGIVARFRDESNPIPTYAIVFKTETGSVYRVDPTDMTWHRIYKDFMSGQIRSEFGHLVGWPFDIRVGCSVSLQDTAVLPGFDAHMVVTSPIVEIYDDANDGPEVELINKLRPRFVAGFTEPFVLKPETAL